MMKMLFRNLSLRPLLSASAALLLCGLLMLFGSTVHAEETDPVSGPFIVAYRSEGPGIISGSTAEDIDPAEYPYPSGTEAVPDDGAMLEGWICDRDVVFESGIVVQAGELLSEEEIRTIPVRENLVLTAVFRVRPMLSVNLSADREAYNGADRILYTIRLKEETENAYAQNIVIRDFAAAGVCLDMENIRISAENRTAAEELLDGIEKEISGKETWREYAETAGQEMTGEEFPEEEEAFGTSFAGGECITVSLSRLSYEDGEVTIAIPAAIDPETFNQSEALNMVTVSCLEMPQEVTDIVMPRVTWRVRTSVRNGTITKTSEIAPGGNAKVVYEGKEGYYLTGLKTDGQEADRTGCETEFIFRDVRANHTLEAAFKRIPELGVSIVSDRDIYSGAWEPVYTIQVTQKAKGARAENTVIRFEAETGLYVDPEEIILSRGIKETEYGEDGMLRAITVKAGPLDCGEDVIITFRASAGKEREGSVLTAGVRALCDGLKQPVSAETAIRLFHTITTSVQNGVITETNPHAVPGGSCSVRYLPKDGYYLSGIKIDGRMADLNLYENEFIFEEIHEDHRIEVLFTRIPVHVR